MTTDTHRTGYPCRMPSDEHKPEQARFAAEERRRVAEQEQAVAERPLAATPPPPGAPPPLEQTQPTGASRFLYILRSRNFRLLWIGEFVSLVGGQLFVVALPWLVLELTGNGLAIGTVLAVSTAPRTVFILVGGGLTDRFSPRAVMLYSNIGRMVLVILLAVLTALGVIQLWMLYAIGLLLGFGFALYLPAQSAMIPRLVSGDRLQTGNAIIQGTAQLALFLGPVLAGVLIAFVGSGGSTVPSAAGIAIVFGLNAVSFAVSAVTLMMIRLPQARRFRGGRAAKGVLRSVGEGLANVWRDKTLRLYFLLIGVVNLALLGPVSVGVPVLAATELAGGALAYGGILSGLGAGALTGAFAGGALRRPPGRLFAAAMLGSTALLGIGLALLGAVPSTAAAIAAAFLIGLAEGYLTVEFITWLQLRSSEEELGRMMSILLFVSVGMAPISNLIAGALIGMQATWLMIGAGCLIVLVAIVAAFSPSVWRLNEVKEELPTAGD